jgi:2-hydroxychromene-2-carboxylate isomerase
MSINIFNIAIAEHYENVDNAIAYLSDLYNDDVDIFDAEVFNAVMKRYGLLDDGFESEQEYIIKQLKERLHI